MKTKIIIIQILTTVHNAKTVFVYNNKQSASKSVNCRGSNISGGSNKKWNLKICILTVEILFFQYDICNYARQLYAKILLLSFCGEGKFIIFYHASGNLQVRFFQRSWFPHTEQMNLQTNRYKCISVISLFWILCNWLFSTDLEELLDQCNEFLKILKYCTIGVKSELTLTV